MKKVDLGNGHILQNILMNSFPLLVAQMLNLLYSIVDRVYIGRIPDIGTEALGAVGLCFPITIMITGFTNMFGLGGSPLFAMEMGRGNKCKAATILNTSFRLEVIMAIVLMIVGEVFGSPLLSLFGATGSQLPTAMSYLRIYLLGTVFLMVATGMNSFITAEGYAMIGMVMVTVGAVANIILDPIFMFALGMGVQGAAVATVISQALSFVISMRFLLSARNEYALTNPFAKQDRPGRGDAAGGPVLAGSVAGGAAASIDAASIDPARAAVANTADAEEVPGGFLPYAGEIIALGTAPFIMQVTNSLVSIACNQVLSAFGGPVYVSIMTVISSVRSIAETPMYAVTDGSSPVISYNYGAGRPENVRRAIKYMLILVFPYTILIWILIRLAPQVFIAIFSDDPTMMTDAVPALQLYFYAFVFQTFQCTGQTVFKSLGKKGQAIFFSLLRKVVLVVPLTYALPYLLGLGTDGVFMAEPVSNVIGGIACFATMLVQIGGELRSMEREAAGDAGDATRLAG